MFEALVEDVITRWDSELAMLERLYYFDKEILKLLLMVELGFPADLLMNRLEFDVAYAMTLVLTPLRVFTKFVQNKSSVTLAYMPQKIDELITALAPGSFAARLAGCAAGVLEEMEKFQRCLVASIKIRFSDIFEGESLALAARYFLPGKDLFQFQNFTVDDAKLEIVTENILSDLVELLPATTTEAQKAKKRTLARAILLAAREALDEEDPEVNPLEWWPNHPDFSILYAVVKMLLQIPASSAENERSFSSASFIMDQRRTRLDIDNFRREHRIRRALCSAASPQEKVERSNALLERFAEKSAQIRAEAQEAPQ